MLYKDAYVIVREEIPTIKADDKIFENFDAAERRVRKHVTSNPNQSPLKIIKLTEWIDLNNESHYQRGKDEVIVEYLKSKL